MSRADPIDVDSLRRELRSAIESLQYARTLAARIENESGENPLPISTRLAIADLMRELALYA